MPLVFQKSSPKILFTVCQSLSTISLGTLGISFYYSQDLELDVLKWLPVISIIFIFLMRAMGYYKFCPNFRNHVCCFFFIPMQIELSFKNVKKLWYRPNRTILLWFISGDAIVSE